MLVSTAQEVPRFAAQLRLTPDQIEAKKALETAVEEVKEELSLEEDISKKEALDVELKEREAKLEQLMDSFEVPDVTSQLDR
jgi:uncharacterized protein YaiL (DUF2058 family)